MLNNLMFFCRKYFFYECLVLFNTKFLIALHIGDIVHNAFKNMEFTFQYTSKFTNIDALKISLTSIV